MLNGRAAALLLALIAAGPALARDDTPPPPSGYPATELLSTGTTVVGEPLAYPAGKPLVTASIVTIGPGAKTVVHKHGVPMFAYILQGELEVNYGADGTRTYKKGDALMEAMNVAHVGINNGAEPVRILVVYMGAEGAHDVIPEQ